MDMARKLLYPLLCQGILYLVQYIAIPLLFANISPTDTARHLMLIISTTAAMAFVGMFFFERRLKYWLLGFVPYIVLTINVRPFRAYGTGTRLFASLDDLRILVLSMTVLAIEVVVWLVIMTVTKSPKQSKTRNVK
jgi:hypothetical protein